MCSCPDCCRGCPSVTAAALLLVCSAMLRNLSFGRELKARTIAASSPEYGFCSDLLPSVEANVMSLVPLLWWGKWGNSQRLFILGMGTHCCGLTSTPNTTLHIK